MEYWPPWEWGRATLLLVLLTQRPQVCLLAKDSPLAVISNRRMHVCFPTHTHLSMNNHSFPRSVYFPAGVSQNFFVPLANLSDDLKLVMCVCVLVTSV
jgi:hypothetical protein